MTCPVCGADLPQEALFCGECGSSVTAKPKTRPLVRDPRPSDTTVIEPLSAPTDAVPTDAVPTDAAPTDAAPAASERTSRIEQPPAPLAEQSQAASQQPSRPETPGEAARPSASVLPTEPEAVSASYTLRFSTGERILVSGSGLIGRRPIAQPGEQPDQLVSVADTGRSVSKTHLEFGIEAGDLWISDRYSANGTAIIQRSGGVRRCEPGRRYRVERGAAIEIGDQRIDVS